jgi:hypothetical protein
MTVNNNIRLSVLNLIVVFQLLCFAIFVQTTGADSRNAMITTLGSSGPHPSLGNEAQVFDRLVGAWNCEFTFYNEDGTKRNMSGEVLFGWVLDGRVLQDIWITYTDDPTKERNIGTSLRFFDRKSKKWEVIFINPVYGVIIVRGGAEGDNIVLRGVDNEDAALRWSFKNIKPDSFVWYGEKSFDKGKTWRLEEEHHMRRRASVTSMQSNSGEQPIIPANFYVKQTAETDESKSIAAFEKLSSLIGEWKGVQDGIEIKLTYTLTADGSALMEEFRPVKGPVMITMFYVDGDRLVATHYCSVGNQPQMITNPIQDPEGPLVFALLRVTGMSTPGEWHNTGLEITIEDRDHLTQKWTYEHKGKTGTNIFNYTRFKH